MHAKKARKYKHTIDLPMDRPIRKVKHMKFNLYPSLVRASLGLL